MTTMTKTPASAAQITFYGSLSATFATRMGGLAGTPEQATAKATEWASTQSMKTVSDAITSLKDKIAAMPKPAAPVVEVGYYATEKDTFFVTQSKSTGKSYAKKWAVKYGMKKATWVYAPGVIYSLAGQTPMTLEQAKAFGHSHGYCIRCGAQLTDPKSVEAGIGPVCAGYWS